jgi:hypothetical protein
MKKKTNIVKEQVLKLALENKGAAEIAKILGFSCGSILRFCRKNNITLNKVKSGGLNMIPMIGKRFGSLVVIDRDWSIKNRVIYWKCKCDCGNVVSSHGPSLRNGRIKTCGCRKGILTSRNWQGTKNIPKTIWGRINQGAKCRDLTISITIEYIDKLATDQNFKCSLSGLDLCFDVKNTTASLDRIDSSKGYIEGNVQWVHKTINNMKWSLSDEEFINFCKIIARHNET